MANEHPFQQLFESFGRLPVSHADSVNRKAYDALNSSLEVPIESPGRCILLKAPRAGHGKTHLLSRLQHHLAVTHEFIPLHASGSRVDALSVTEDALKRLVRPLPAAGGLTVLDLVARRLFAYALQPLVISGEVPCQDREGALTALKIRPVETFDFHHPNAATAHWARENFEVLGPRLSMELAQRSGVPIRDVSFWVSAFFRYAATPSDHPGRAGTLGLEVAGEASSEGVAMERLFALLALLSLLMRVVLVADDLEGFSADETAALRFAAFVGAIRQSAERVDVILSLNQDVWENAFLPRLSGGLSDRLSEIAIDLEPLSDEEVVALFDSRAPGLGQQVLDRVDASERHARGLIRAAGVAWVKAASEAPAAVEPVAPLAGAAPEPIASAEPESENETEKPVSEEAPAPAFAFPPAEISTQPVFQEREEIAPISEEPNSTAKDEDANSEVPIAETSEATPPPQWSGNPIFEATVTEEPIQHSRPFANDPAPAYQADSPFQAVFADDAPPVPSEPAPAPFHDASEAPVSLGPPPHTAPAQSPTNPENETDRVDDLLKQFRERYGR